MIVTCARQTGHSAAGSGVETKSPSAEVSRAEGSGILRCGTSHRRGVGLVVGSVLWANDSEIEQQSAPALNRVQTMAIFSSFMFRRVGMALR